MQVAFSALLLSALLFPGTGLGDVQPLAGEIHPISSRTTVTQTRQPADQKKIKTIIPVSLPVSATVWLEAGGSTTGQVKGLDRQLEALTLGKKSIALAQIKKIVFDRQSLTYKSDGKPIIIRGEDNAKAEQKSWQNIPLSAFKIKDPELGQAQVNLDGIMKSLELRGIRSVAVRSVYVVNEIKLQPDGNMTVMVTPTDR